MTGAFVVAGLGFGDEGKGATVDALVRHTGADLVIRYNGGAQCAHNVVTTDGRHHTFAQFGSGTFVPGTRTYLSRFVLVNPVSMLIEADVLSKVGIDDAFDRTWVDGRAVVITPYQKALNRLEEIARKGNRHGSTGMGIGVTRRDSLSYGDKVLFVGDLPNSTRTIEKMEFIRTICIDRANELILPPNNSNAKRELDLLSSKSVQLWYLSKYKEWVRRANISNNPPAIYTGLVFEGGQGMLLDETHGFHPHTTWTDITFNNAETILQEMGYKGTKYKIGVLRAYFTRHGDGPFPSEAPSLRELSHYSERHNTGMDYTGAFRLGYFDVAMAMYAINRIGGVDSLAINHVDVVAQDPTVKVRIPGEGTMDTTYEDFLPITESLLETPISIVGAGPTHDNRTFIKSIWSPREGKCLQ